MEKPFVHLHVHSEYSLLDGANGCADLAAATKEMGMSAVALTDHGVMYGAVEFFNKCVGQGVKPIIGCEVYVDPNGHTCREGKNQYHLILLAENEEGYRNLVKLVSVANTDGFYYKPRIDHALLSKYSKGLIGASACLGGEIPAFILKGDLDAAAARAQLYRDILGHDNFFLEIQANSMPEQALVNKALVDIARRDGYELIATNDAHYMRRSDAEWHDVLLCTQTQSKIDDPNRYRFSGDDYYFRSPEEMWDIFGQELPDSLLNTQKIADRCDLDLRKKDYFLPDFALPEGDTLDTFLEKQSLDGLKRRLKTENPPEKYMERLKYELKVIEQMGFPGYFCIVADIIAAARAKNIPVGPGRGSAAGSVVAWALGITDLDPLRYNLLFERFLNPERISMPDIDTDVSDKRRDEVISYIVEKYGSDKVAQIITFGRMKSKMAVADIGRAMGMPVPDVREVTKLIPDSLKSGIKSIPEAIESVPDLKALYNTNAQVHKLLDYAKNMEGIARHCSQHAAGIVITPRPIMEMVPVRKFGDNQIATQYSMEPVEQLGLVKMDFLGLKTLSVLEGALENIEASGKGKIDLSDIPMDDPKTFELLQRGDTLGIFQLESTGMTALVKRLKPDCFEDMIALVALYRPGPLESGMVDQYVRRKHKEETVTYKHPALENSLKETYGVILYQEQVMQSASELADYTLGQADLLRKAMGKKKVEEMEKQREKFVAGAIRKGVPSDKAVEIFDVIEKFAGYGFNKSHSAAYGLISYRTAWLKANYGAEFLAAYLSSLIGSKMDDLGQYIRKVRDAGYAVLPPDINESKDNFTVTGDKEIRLGLSAVGKVGNAAVENIIATRHSEGPFKSFWDFLKKIDSRVVNKGVVENLIKSGAFDRISCNRAQLLEALPTFMELAAKQSKDTNQGSLFADADDAGLEPQLPECPDFSEREKLDCEKESMGLYISAHPFDHYKQTAACYATCPLGELQRWKPTQLPVTVAGLVSSVKERFTKKGDPMGIAELEDADGSVEIVIYPRQWEKFKPYISIGNFYFIRGQVREDRGTSVIADEIFTEDEFREKIDPHVVLTLDASGLGRDYYEGLFRVFQSKPGKTKIMLKVVNGDQTIVAMLNGVGIEADEELFGAIKEYSGGRIAIEYCP
ncbi:DNA polymerase III subunit alpha [Synergistaceae bacterium OttesenSCG-928-D05]|nr:DNA polymerase III subunit alpha [Synergistaceae bacterium OttesenSCG-928-D05]